MTDLGQGPAMPRVEVDFRSAQTDRCVSWVTYARPFAARISAYRKIAARKAMDGIYDYPSRDFIECVKWTWHEFKQHMRRDLRKTG